MGKSVSRCGVCWCNRAALWCCSPKEAQNRAKCGRRLASWQASWPISIKLFSSPQFALQGEKFNTFALETRKPAEIWQTLATIYDPKAAAAKFGRRKSRSRRSHPAGRLSISKRHATRITPAIGCNRYLVCARLESNRLESRPTTISRPRVSISRLAGCGCITASRLADRWARAGRPSGRSLAPVGARPWSAGGASLSCIRQSQTCVWPGKAATRQARGPIWLVSSPNRVQVQVRA